MTPKVTALQQQLQQLRAQHAAGNLSQAKYDEARAKLERQLLDQIVEAPAAIPAKRAGVQTWALIGAAMVIVAAAGYGLTGTPEHINPLPGEFAGGGQAAPHDTSEEQMAVLVQQLANRMQANPDDAEGWMTLGRSYAAMGRSTEALQALERAVKLVPEDAAVLADYADALAVQNGRDLEGEPLQYIERALQADPNHLKSLALAGTAAFNRQDWAKAVEYWDRAVLAGPPSNPIVQMAMNAVAEARERGKLPASAGAASAAALIAGKPPAATAAPAPAAPAPAAQPAPAAATAQAATPAAAAAASITGTISLSPALRAKVSPDDPVYIFARAAEGSRMPLALTRKLVKDLPATFTLDDSMAMSPASLLSSADKVVVGARVSKSGQPMPRPGDFEGLSAPLAVGGKGVLVEISSEIK